MSKTFNDINKIKKHKDEYQPKRMKVEKITKEALNILSNLRINIYQRLYYLITTPVEDWKQFDFLSSKTKIENFIEKIETEIKKVKSDNYNFEKYRTAILCIIGKNADKFNPAIIKNMYIAKLQTIIFIIKENNNDNDIKEVKNTTLSR